MDELSGIPFTLQGKKKQQASTQICLKESINKSIKLTSNNSTLANSNFSLTRTKTNFSENPPLIYRDFTLDNSNPPEKIKDSLFSLSWRFELSGVAVLVKNNYKGSRTERKRRGLDYTNWTVQMQSIHTQNHSHTHTHTHKKDRHRRIISDIGKPKSSSLVVRILVVVIY